MSDLKDTRSHIEKLTSTDTELKRDLTLFSAINIVIGGVLGSGIFMVASTMAQQLPSPFLIIVAWIVGGLLSLAGCLAYSELSAAMPQSGGQYVYLREAYGEKIAFLNGWTQFLVVQPGCIASVAAAFSIYAGYFFPTFGDMGLRLIAVAVIIVLTIINYLGVKEGSLINNIFTVAKVAAILILIGAGLFISPELASGNFQNFFTLNGVNLSTFGLAMIAVLWGYQGWDYTTFIAEEVKNPKKNVPLALSIGMIILIVIYIITNLAYLNVLTLGEMASATLPAADVALKVIGPTGGALISIAIMVSCFGSNNANILAAPRIYYAMAKDGLFFKKCAEVHPKFKTPGFSLIVGGVWACVLAMTNSFDQLYSMTVFAAFAFYALGGISVFVLRKKYPAIERPYKAPAFVVIVFILVSVVFVVNALVTSFNASLLGLVLIVIGFPVYAAFKKRRA
ncbi:APC family permease [Aminipila terrae]|uniref:Amino acid permease n=1 Tax=Aminipila terrae TaxID=2697030 RepID=A0A6P1MI61_9FIRM|nr:amino acid permease [Aminipila terrae]QHI71286.1 amino acid permease [Aminipila terrae]